MFTGFKIEKKVLIVALAGLAVRLFFILIGAKFYFNRPDIFIDGDTQVWAACIENLIKHGTYKITASHEYSYFARMPGYSFFMGIFYLLTGQNWDAAYPIIAWFQTLLDFFGIILIYRIGEKLFSGTRTALTLAWLYAFYPFVIVWTPVVYSEYMSIFFLLLSVYCFLHGEKKWGYSLSGLFLGLGVLFRPQLILLAPVLAVTILIRYRKQTGAAFKKTFLFTLLFLVAYAPWPIRNYVNYDKLILTQDLRGIPNWDIDALAFMEYIYSVKAEWEPQFSQIVENKKVEWPRTAYLSEGDSAKLAHVTFLSQNCGRGFSNWRNYWKESVGDDNCSKEIKEIFDGLRKEQMEKNAFHFWVVLPLQNLKKAIFKLTLYDTSTLARKAASLLFVYRTLLLLIGIFGCYSLLKSNQPGAYFGGVALSYFLILYITLCSGIGPQFRNIEMRYFLQADVIMLIPAAFVINMLYNRLRGKKE